MSEFAEFEQEPKTYWEKRCNLLEDLINDLTDIIGRELTTDGYVDMLDAYNSNWELVKKIEHDK